MTHITDFILWSHDPVDVTKRRCQGQNLTQTTQRKTWKVDYVSTIWYSRYIMWNHIVNEKKGKVPKIIACIGKLAASVFLKLIINGYWRCHTTDAFYRMQCNHHTIHDPRKLEKYNYIIHFVKTSIKTSTMY